MPTYFSIDFQYRRADLCKTTVNDFFKNLTDCGLVYKSGFWHSKNDGLNDILIWNQKKLEDNFELGYTEHYSHDYKQMLFDFRDFSEVRLIMQNIPEKGSFTFCLIIPEDDFIEYNDTGKYKRLEHKMQIVEDFACHMWEVGDMSCIQSFWECSGCYDISDIIKGDEPSFEPFAIVPANTYRTKWNCSCEMIGRDGVILKNDNNWFYG